MLAGLFYLKHVVAATHDSRNRHKSPEHLFTIRSQLRGLLLGQAHIPFGVTDRTSGPHPWPDPPTDEW